MKKCMILLLAMLLTMGAALADSGFSDAVFDLREQINGNLSASGFQSDMFNAMQVQEDCYVLVSDDGNTLMRVEPNASESAIGAVILFCGSQPAIKAAMEDVAFMAYWFGSRDSIEAATGWGERWYSALCQAWQSGSPMETDICETAGMEARGSVFIDEGKPVVALQVTSYY